MPPSNLSSHSSMPSLISFDTTETDFETNSTCTTIYYSPRTRDFIYPLPPPLFHFIPESYMFLADWYFIIRKTTINTNDFESPSPSDFSASYTFYLFAENIAPLPSIHVQLPDSLAAHIPLP